MTTDLVISFPLNVGKIPGARSIGVWHAAGGKPTARERYRSWLKQFEQPNGEILPGLFKAAGGMGGIGRIAAIGFSAGCMGLDELLAYPDTNKIDVMIAADGIHGEYKNGHIIDEVWYQRWINRANQCINDPSKKFCILHSAIIPGSFPSTTETASFIWKSTDQSIYDDKSVSLIDSMLYENELKERSNSTHCNGGFVVMGFMSDHGFIKNKVIKHVIQKLIIDDWYKSS